VKLLEGNGNIDIAAIDEKQFDFCKGCADLEKLKDRASGRRNADKAIGILVDKLFDRVHLCRNELVDTSSSLRKRLEELTILTKVTDNLLKTDDLGKALAIVLTGVTSGEAFRFNRAAIFLCDQRSNSLKGVAAIGSADREEAKRIWMRLDSEQPSFDELLERIHSSNIVFKDSFYYAIKDISIPLSNDDNILIKVIKSKQPYFLKPGETFASCCPQLKGVADTPGFVAVPIATDSLDFGVLIADNFLTKIPISEDDILSLKTFANSTAAILENIGLQNQLKFKIQELKHANNMLRENQSYLVQHERLADIGRLATTVTHEIKTPLVTIGAYTRRMLKTFGTKRFKRKHLEIILREVERLEKISTEILDYSRSSKLEFQECNLKDIIGDILVLIKQKLEEAGINEKTRLSPNGIVIRVDPNRIRQVLYNLVQNAVDEMKSGGTLMIRTRSDDKYAIVDIEDTGDGIPEDVQGKLFTPFFSTKAKGSGLGLPVSKKIIEDHGGFIKFVTRKGVGTRFSVYLPKLELRKDKNNVDKSEGGTDEKGYDNRG